MANTDEATYKMDLNESRQATMKPGNIPKVTLAIPYAPPAKGRALDNSASVKIKQMKPDDIITVAIMYVPNPADNPSFHAK
mmetsp:Transcript_119018/g.233805  ORF Transcript_119018/g.233805 Transcript_119018/m.233805 type:complete len:81 (-) Transcript_119018:223-465(-)